MTRNKIIFNRLLTLYAFPLPVSVASQHACVVGVVTVAIPNNNMKRQEESRVGTLPEMMYLTGLTRRQSVGWWRRHYKVY